MLTEQQRQERLNYVTGSDAGVICGVNPYMNIVDLYLIKTGLNSQKDVSNKPHVKAGNYLEPAIAKWFEDETGLVTEESGEMLIHKDIPWMAGNIDRKIVGRPKEILEIKTASNDKSWGVPGDETTIPDQYLMQCCHYCAVADADICWIAVLFHGSDFRIYRYDRNLNLENKLIEKERHFWIENVQKNIPPEPMTAKEVISLRGNIEVGGFVIATPEIEKAVSSYKELCILSDLYNEKIRELKDEICVAMGTNESLLDGFGKPLATWKKISPAKRFDRNEFEKIYPELCKQFTYESEPLRRFMIKR